MKHLPLILFIPIGIFFLALIFVVNGNSILILQAVTALSLIYLVFSFMHHLADKSLTVEASLEYILIASLVVILLAGVTI